MTRAMPIALAVAAVVLIATIGLELGVDSGEAGALSGLAPRPAKPALPEPSAGSQDRGQEWAATILARPLFNRDRRPVANPGDNAPQTTKGLPRLAGILVSPLGRTAIFAASDGGKPIAVPEGGRLGELIVQAIEFGQVTMSGPEGQRILQPSFDNAVTPNPPVASGSPVLTSGTEQISQGNAK
jgi:hypothetical protein